MVKVCEKCGAMLECTKSDFTSIVKYLVDNLNIDVDREVEFGPREVIRVRLRLGYNVISEDHCEIHTHVELADQPTLSR